MQNNNNQNYMVNPQTGEVGEKKQPFSVFMEKMGNRLVEKTLQDPRRRTQFIANIVSAVSNNKQLEECDQTSIVSAALQAEVLHFPITNSLGYAYLVPYNVTEYNRKTRRREVVGKAAQFQIGYKGYIQLAIRSGQFKKINVVEVKEGEVGGYNPLEDDFEFNWISDYETRKQKKTVGYVGMFELTNGFKKTMYFTYEEMLDHANNYSQAFDKEIFKRIQAGEPVEDAWKYSSFWYKDFDEMAKKTVIRQLLSKWAPMSVEMIEAYTKDQAEITPEGKPKYVDSVDASYREIKQQQAQMGTVAPPIQEPAQPQYSAPAAQPEEEPTYSQASYDFDNVTI